MRYTNAGYARPARHDVVPRHVALQVARERDALASTLERARVDSRRMSTENERLRARLAELERGASSKRSEEDERRERRVRALTELYEAEREARVRAESERDAALERDPSPEQTEATGALVARLEARVDELLADLSRLRAQVERVEGEGVRRGERGVLLDLMSVRDDIARAVEFSGDEGGPWAEGTRRLLEQFDAALARRGVAAFGVAGDAFDPSIHEAVGVLRGVGEAGSLGRIERPGFVFVEDGSLLRPAQVVVAA